MTQDRVDRDAAGSWGLRVYFGISLGVVNRYRVS